MMLVNMMMMMMNFEDKELQYSSAWPEFTEICLPCSPKYWNQRHALAIPSLNYEIDFN